MLADLGVISVIQNNEERAFEPLAEPNKLSKHSSKGLKAGSKHLKTESSSSLQSRNHSDNEHESLSKAAEESRNAAVGPTILVTARFVAGLGPRHEQLIAKGDRDLAQSMRWLLAQCQPYHERALCSQHLRYGNVQWTPRSASFPIKLQMRQLPSQPRSLPR